MSVLIVGRTSPGVRARRLLRKWQYTADVFAQETRLTYAMRRMMNEDTFNIEVRKFLKKVGITSQREIERAVREAIAAGTVTGSTRLKARMTLEVEGLDLKFVIEDEIALS